MLGHELFLGDTLLPTLPVPTAVTTLTRLTALSRSAAAHHAVKGGVHTYAGTIVVAYREDDPLTNLPTTMVLAVDPHVLRHDPDGLLIALGSGLPADRLVIRSAVPVDRFRQPPLRLAAHVLERVPTAKILSTASDCAVSAATTVDDIAFAQSLLLGACDKAAELKPQHAARWVADVVGLGDPARSTTLVARRRGELVGAVTWCTRLDAFDRERRAEVVDLSVLPGAPVDIVTTALVTEMEQRVGPTAGQRLRLTVATDDEDRLALLITHGWVRAFSWWGADPWIPGARRLVMP